MYHFYCLLMFSLFLFLYQFFPMSSDPKKHQNNLPTYINDFKIENIEETYPKHFDKLVLVVIDALRMDFVTPELMPFTSKAINSLGCFNRITVESPTVTLPRIKALTSGHIPQYIDLIKNLAASEVLTDSWLHSARERGFRMVFYGDNNWLPLFPDFFQRFEGTSSFDVRDFTEVDNNVTRNVNLEVERTDWDIMILHYLGLDHIGHVHGPFHQKIPPKLLEMDKIIEHIYKKVVIDQKAMLLVTGDHGMRDSGGHGGTSPAETNVPLIALGFPCENSSFPQTDIPANLAVSLAIKIPSTSIGRINRLFLKFLTNEQYLYSLNYNIKTLLNLKNLCESDFKIASEYHEKYLRTGLKIDRDSARELYQNCLRILADSLYEISHKHDHFLIVLSMLSMASVITVFVSKIRISDQYNPSLDFIVILFIILISLVFKMNDIEWIFALVLVFLIGKNISKSYSQLKLLPIPDFFNLFLLGICVIHPLTLLSTSFIEEEHYFWYYFGTSFFLILTIKNGRENQVFGQILSLFFLRIVREFNSTETNGNILNFDNEGIAQEIIFIFGLLIILYTLARSEKCPKKTVFYSVIIFLIFLIKTESSHSILLGKLTWFLIFLEFVLSKVTLTKNSCILVGTLLLKPHNILFIPIALFISKIFSNFQKPTLNLNTLVYIFSNYFYFAQGHRNSLSSVDISVGYLGLTEYNPFLVITQNVIHIFIFMILFHSLALEKIDSNSKSNFWLALFMLKSFVLLFTCFVTVINKYHLFIWSVFAPKLFIESVHMMFLFVEVSLWYCFSFCHNKS